MIRAATRFYDTVAITGRHASGIVELVQHVSVEQTGAGRSAAVTSPLATVIVVNWNGAHLLPACLDGLRRQNGAVPFETWVVDNASHDESVAADARALPRGAHHRSPIETGASPAATTSRWRW